MLGNIVGMNWAEKVRKLRKGRTYKAIEVKSGYPKGQLSDDVNNARDIGPKKVAALIHFFGVPGDWLFDEKQDWREPERSPVPYTAKEATALIKTMINGLIRLVERLGDQAAPARSAGPPPELGQRVLGRVRKEPSPRKHGRKGKGGGTG